MSLGSELKLDFGHGVPEDGGLNSKVEVSVHDELYNLAKFTMFYATYSALGQVDRSLLRQEQFGQVALVVQRTRQVIILI